MATSFLLAAVLSLALCTHGYDCTYKNGADTYDISSLQNAQKDYTFTNTVGSTTYTFYVNVCRQNVVTTSCSKAQHPTTVAVCQTWNTLQASLGDTSTAMFWPPGVPGDNGKGFKLNFTNGDPAQTPPQPRSLEIDFVCDSSAGDGMPSYTSEAPTLHYNFVWRSAKACPVSGSPSSGGKSEGGISGGSVFLIIIVCAVALYLLGGVLFQKFYRHNSGLELLPNLAFWIDFFRLVKEGALFIFNKVTRRTTSYSNL